MHEYRQTMTIPADHILHLSVPNIPKGEEVEVLVRSKIDSREKKLAMLALAASDPLFQSDVREIEEDFGDADAEHA